MLFYRGAGLGKAFSRIANHAFVHTEGQAEMARAAKARAGYCQHALFKQGVYKGHVVATGRLGEEIKGPRGHLEFVVGLFKHLGHGFTAGGINFKVHLAAQGCSHDVLAHHGRIDKAQNAVGKGKGGHEQLFFFCGQLGRNCGVAQAFARQGKAFGKRADGNGIRIERQHRRHFHAVISQLPVRLIGDQVNVRAECLLLFL